MELRPLLTLAITSTIPVIGLAVLGTQPGVADGRHNTGAQEFLLASAPPPVQQDVQVWAPLKKDVALADLAVDLGLNPDHLAELNEQSIDASLPQGSWVVLPTTTKRLLALSRFVDASKAQGSAPLTAPPAPTGNVVKVTSGDSVAKIASRHGLSLKDLRNLNPGLNLSRLTIGSEIRVAKAGAGSLLAVRPTISGGASWPSLPSLPSGKSKLESQTFLWPTQGVFTSGYGWRWGRMHKGIDIANNVGTPIFAAKDGVVVYSGWMSGYGYLVEMNHGDGTTTRYGHNSRLLVRKGQIVPQGQTISLMGSTGRSTGPHLHFEIRSAGGGAIDPMRLLPSRRA